MTDGAHGERAAEDEDMLHCRQTSGGTGAGRDVRRGRPPLPLSFSCTFAAETLTVRHIKLRVKDASLAFVKSRKCLC